MSIFLVILGLLVVLGGILSLTQATLGVGLIAIGCFLAILARLAQAEAQHRKILPPKVQHFIRGGRLRRRLTPALDTGE